MSRRPTLLLGCLIGTLSAQQAPTWPLEEATVSALLPAIVQGSAVPQSGKGNRALAIPVGTIGGYSLRTMAAPRTAGAGDVTYAWPQNTTGRTFAMTDRGSVMFTSERAEAPLQDGQELPAAEPLWSALIAKGSELRMDQMLDMPGRGMDDRIWQPLATAKQITSSITVQTRDGKPIVGVTIAVGAPSWLDGATHVDLGTAITAVGLATTGAEGAAQLRSVPTTGAQLAIAIGSEFLDVPMQLETRKGGLVLVVESEAIPEIVAKVCKANESAAIATLRNLASGQAQAQACGANDANGNGKGEYAFLAQLSGVAELQQAAAPGGEVRFVPPVLSTAFSRVRGSCVLRGGYLFQVFLPGKDGWVAEAPTGGARGVEVDATRAEAEWCAVAWPVQSGVTGTRAFWIHSNGDILATASGELFSGRAKRPKPDAAEVLREPLKPQR